MSDGCVVIFGVVSVVPPFRVPPLTRMVPLLVNLLSQLSLEPSGMVRVSPLLMVRLSSSVTLPYTVPSVPSKTMPPLVPVVLIVVSI